ncbi:hypothetical protein VTN49DRAFT_5789 [Thermomyces lanuginosus]|uniref:uncharacterized protein n=1 Tax=Thermomyces lanuginosus TaxID=5541 RepID=UPI003742730D
MSKNTRSTLQFRQVMNDRARRGERLTDEEIDEITRETIDLAGTSSNENSLQSEWANRSREILQKPANRLTNNDARELHSLEFRAFERLPAQGSLSSHVMSQADKNERRLF